MSRQTSPMSCVFDIVENRMGCIVSNKDKKMLKNHLERTNANQLLNEGNYNRVAEMCIDKIIAWDIEKCF